MINRIHGHPSDMGPAPKPSCAAGFACGYVFVLHVSELTDRGPAIQKNHTHLPGRELDQCISILFGHQLGEGTGTSDDLPAAPDTQFDIVNVSAQRYIAQRQRVAGLYVGSGTGFHHVADF
jgi:hypothetical protein